MSTTTSPPVDRTALAPRLRRLQLALEDLGIARIVGDGWVVIGGTGFEFAELGDEATDRLVRHAEDLARLHAVALRRECGASDRPPAEVVAAPVAPPRGAPTVHLVVPR